MSTPNHELTIAEVFLLDDVADIYRREVGTMATTDATIAFNEDLPEDSPTELVLVGLAYLPEAVRVLRMTRIHGKIGECTMITDSEIGSRNPRTLIIAPTGATVVGENAIGRADDAVVEDVRALLAETLWDPTLSAGAVDL